MPNQPKLPSSRIPEIVQVGRYLHSSHLMLKWLPSPTIKSRGQVLVPQSVARKAFQRNHLKRRLRTLLTANQSPIQAKDYLLIAKRGVAEQSAETLNQQFQHILKQLTP